MRRTLLSITGAVLVMCAGTASAEMKTVTVNSGSYSPSEITVVAGDVIRFTNVSGIDHAVTSFNPNQDTQVGMFFDTMLAPGTSFDWTVPAPPLRPMRGDENGGVIGCFCKGHAQVKGERMLIRVNWPNPTPSTP
jgi:plastocyanin